MRFPPPGGRRFACSRSALFLRVAHGAPPETGGRRKEANNSRASVECVKHHSRSFAVKRMPNRWIKSKPFDESNPMSSEKPWIEIGLLRYLNALQFPHVCNLMGIFRDEEYTYVATSVCVKFPAGAPLIMQGCPADEAQRVAAASDRRAATDSLRLLFYRRSVFLAASGQRPEACGCAVLDPSRTVKNPLERVSRVRAARRPSYNDCGWGPMLERPTEPCNFCAASGRSLAAASLSGPNSATNRAYLVAPTVNSFKQLGIDQLDVPFADGSTPPPEFVSNFDHHSSEVSVARQWFVEGRKSTKSGH
eukprot:Skav234109  [mRNA]  locus=scaffold2732:71342:74805:+ [translate_table: standard]